MSGVLGAEGRRNQNLDFLTNQLGMRIAEEFFALSIDEHDAALAVDNQHRIGRGIKDHAEVRFNGDFHGLPRLAEIVYPLCGSSAE